MDFIEWAICEPTSLYIYIYNKYIYTYIYIYVCIHVLLHVFLYIYMLYMCTTHSEAVDQFKKWLVAGEANAESYIQ